jgi:hypothetical protein
VKEKEEVGVALFRREATPGYKCKCNVSLYLLARFFAFHSSNLNNFRTIFKLKILKFSVVFSKLNTKDFRDSKKKCKVKNARLFFARRISKFKPTAIALENSQKYMGTVVTKYVLSFALLNYRPSFFRPYHIYFLFTPSFSFFLP